MIGLSLVETFRRALRIAAGLEPIKPDGAITREYLDLLPIFVLGGFAGIRSCEQRDATSEVIRWSNLHFDGEKPNVQIRPEVAKLTKATGIKLVENGLRNSFATYATAYDGESAIGAVARQMGNDAKTARRYYQRKLTEWHR